MKKTFFMMAIATSIIACGTSPNSDNAEGGSNNIKSAAALPYTASYSSSFEIGNADYSASILQGWKDWENNHLDDMRSWAADSVVAYQSNNSVVRGVDSLMADWKQARSRYTAVIDTIDAVIPVYSTDRKENWVLVWATEINTKADGTKDTVALMETWRINKDGKADLLLQFERRKRNP